jgi:hypothetical protein
MQGLEQRQPPYQPSCEKRPQHADAQWPLASDCARVVNRILQRVQSLPDLGQQLHTVRGQLNVPALPSKQSQAKVLFERLDLHAYRAHRHAQRFRSSRKLQVLGNGYEYAKTA